ncbi:MAG: EF2563 family selenium-dependent molybdenum hydroxylase system protein [Clostridia bacterium]|nr:EF2563 family selenium-dependent molybdenum hydroxylase system protein [Clostridia bacterium]
MLVLIKGAGDLATGIAQRLRTAHIQVAMTDIKKPSAIRRTAAFSEAMYNGAATVEGLTALRAENAAHAKEILSQGNIPVLADPSGAEALKLAPDAVIDAIIAKRNTGTSITDARLVLGVGPGFTVGTDCHAAIETKRGHHLGRVYYEAGQSPIPNTGIPGMIAGYGAERVMHAPAAGIFHCIRRIGDTVAAGEVVATVGGENVIAAIPGILRGLLPEGYDTPKGMKCADVDPRCTKDHCFTVSDKARAIGGGALEAILAFGLL